MIIVIWYQRFGGASSATRRYPSLPGTTSHLTEIASTPTLSSWQFRKYSDTLAILVLVLCKSVRIVYKFPTGGTRGDVFLQDSPRLARGALHVLVLAHISHVIPVLYL